MAGLMQQVNPVFLFDLKDELQVDSGDKNSQYAQNPGSVFTDVSATTMVYS